MNRPTAAELDRRARRAGEHQAGGCCSGVLASVFIGHGIGVSRQNREGIDFRVDRQCQLSLFQ